MKPAESTAAIAAAFAASALALTVSALAQSPTVSEVAGRSEVRAAWSEVAGPLAHALRVTVTATLDVLKGQGGDGLSAAA
jgi:hypothetical protein